MIRGMESDDVEPLVALVEAAKVFRPDEVEVAREVLESCASKGEASGYLCRVCEDRGAPTGFACFGPTPCTEGTFDLYWIVVDPRLQARGVASRLLETAAAEAARRGGRQLIAETSGTDPYLPARTFYEVRGFRAVARIPDFYRVGDEKIVYVKPLHPIREGGS